MCVYFPGECIIPMIIYHAAVYTSDKFIIGYNIFYIMYIYRWGFLVEAIGKKIYIVKSTALINKTFYEQT